MRMEAARATVAPFFRLLDRLIPNPCQPNPNSFAFAFLGYPIHSLDGYLHGSSKVLEVPERRVGHATMLWESATPVRKRDDE